MSFTERSTQVKWPRSSDVVVIWLIIAIGAGLMISILAPFVTFFVGEPTWSAFGRLAGEQAIALLPAAAYLYALLALWRLMRRAEPGPTGETLTPAIEVLGNSLVVGAIASAVVSPMLWAWTHGRTFGVEPTGQDLIIAAIGLVLIKLAAAVRAAEAAKAELDHMI